MITKHTTVKKPYGVSGQKDFGPHGPIKELLIESTVYVSVLDMLKIATRTYLSRKERLCLVWSILKTLFTDNRNRTGRSGLKRPEGPEGPEGFNAGRMGGVAQ